MHTEFTLLIDILIPALNEEEALPHVLKPLSHLAQSSPLPKSQMTIRQILVVNNGSVDQTAQVAHSFGAVVINEPRRGYGFACLAGIEAIKTDPPDIVLFVDADGSDDINDLEQLLMVFNHSVDDLFSDPRNRLAVTTSTPVSLVIGSRPHLAAEDALTPLQRFGNALSCFLLKLIFKAQFTDLGPLRAIRWSTLVALNMADQTYGWTVEMQAKACALGFTCAERDVYYYPRKAGRSKISGTLKGSFLAGCKIIWLIAKAWSKRL